MHFGEWHSNNSINDKNSLFENYIPKCYNVKRILISFNCFSEYSFKGADMFDKYLISPSGEISMKIAWAE